MTSYEAQYLEAKAELEEISSLPRWKQVKFIWDNMAMSHDDRLKEFWINSLSKAEQELLPTLDAAYRSGYMDGLNDYPSQH